MNGTLCQVLFLLQHFKHLGVFFCFLVVGLKVAYLNLSPILSRDCQAPESERQLHVVDAKSCYDALIRRGSGSTRDRRTAIELAIVAEDMARSGAAVRWVPHSRMVVDVLTKADVAHTNAALSELVRSGHLQLVDEQREIAARGAGESSKSRSRAASQRALDSSTAECDAFPEVRI